jgi:hypothetical protein
VRVRNLLPACKNLGVTHITNGCYRLHPVEWNIGEAAGALVAHCLNHNLTPRQVRNTPNHLADFQHILTDQLGFVLAWPRTPPSLPANRPSAVPHEGVRDRGHARRSSLHTVPVLLSWRPPSPRDKSPRQSPCPMLR